MNAPSRRLILSCALLALACLLVALWSLQSGAVSLTLTQVFAALTGDAPRGIQLVVNEWRLPRVLIALLTGAALGISGAIFQSLMRNPLGSPDVMGFNTGAWSGKKDAAYDQCTIVNRKTVKEARIYHSSA